MDPRVFPDISNYTARFQAHQAASAGCLLVGVMCTDGLDFYSDRHAEQAAHAHEAGMSVWHYHFCRPEQNPTGTGEAAWFWRHASAHYQPGDRLSLDVERAHPGGFGQLAQYVKHVDGHLSHISGQAEVCYMPDAMFRECGPRLQVVSGDFWIASWGGHVRRLGHGRRMVAQQISNGEEGYEPHRVPGIGQCDTNRLQRWYYRRLRRDLARRRKVRLQHVC